MATTGEDVELFMYDLSNGMAAQLSLQLTGKYIPAIWHTSISVFGQEVFFGQGVQRTHPGRSHHGAPHKTLKLGRTQIDKDTFEDYVQAISSEYTAEKYHLLNFNCNNFTNDMAGFLLGRQIPQDIIDLPKEFLSTPFGASLRPMIDNMYRQSAGSSGSIEPWTPQSVSNPDIQGVLQQVANSAQAGHIPNVTAALSSELTIITNQASLDSFLASHSGAVIMATADWCGPCKVIKPVFEQLAKQRAEDGEAQLGFALVKESCGSDVIQALQVSAFPTFLFYHRSQQVHILRGANASELKAQVGMLSLTAYPLHPHAKLPLLVISDLRIPPITYPQHANVSAAIDRLETYCSNDTEQNAVRRIRILMPALQNNPKQLSSEQAAHLSSDASILSDNLPLAKQFPLLDLLRIAILQSTFIAEILASPPEASILKVALARGTSPASTKATRATLIRFSANALHSSLVADSILSQSEPRNHLTQLIVSSLLADEASVRASAGGLAYTVACHMKSKRHRWTPSSDDKSTSSLQEMEVELCIALLEAFDRETTAEVAFRLLAALGTILYLSTSWQSSLSETMEALNAKRTLHSKDTLFSANKTARDLIRDICTLCEE